MRRGRFLLLAVALAGFAACGPLPTEPGPEADRPEPQFDGPARDGDDGPKIDPLG